MSLTNNTGAFRPWNPPFKSHEGIISDENNKPALEVRGWGYLTGPEPGACNLPQADARGAQIDLAAVVAGLMNEHAGLNLGQVKLFDEWMEGHRRSGADLRGASYPVVKAAFLAGMTAAGNLMPGDAEHFHAVHRLLVEAQAKPDEASTPAPASEPVAPAEDEPVTQGNYYDQVYSQDNPCGEAHGWIQWKGTEVCIDLHCSCGYHGHYDGAFLYHYECPRCKKRYAVGQNVKLIALTPAQAAFVEKNRTGFRTDDHYNPDEEE